MTTDFYNLLAVPVNSGCSTYYHIVNPNIPPTDGEVVVFDSDSAIVANSQIQTLPPLQSPVLGYTSLSVLIKSTYGNTLILQFLPAPPDYGDNIYLLSFSTTVSISSNFIIANYGTLYASADCLVTITGKTGLGLSTFLLRSHENPAQLVCVMGSAVDVYLAVSNGYLVEPIPVVWNFQSVYL